MTSLPSSHSDGAVMPRPVTPFGNGAGLAAAMPMMGGAMRWSDLQPQAPVETAPPLSQFDPPPWQGGLAGLPLDGAIAPQLSGIDIAPMDDSPHNDNWPQSTPGRQNAAAPIVQVVPVPSAAGTVRPQVAAPDELAADGTAPSHVFVKQQSSPPPLVLPEQIAHDKDVAAAPMSPAALQRADALAMPPTRSREASADRTLGPGLSLPIMPVQMPPEPQVRDASRVAQPSQGTAASVPAPHRRDPGAAVHVQSRPTAIGQPVGLLPPTPVARAAGQDKSLVVPAESISTPRRIDQAAESAPVTPTAPEARPAVVPPASLPATGMSSPRAGRNGLGSAPLPRQDVYSTAEVPVQATTTPGPDTSRQANTRPTSAPIAWKAVTGHARSVNSGMHPVPVFKRGAASPMPGKAKQAEGVTAPAAAVAIASTGAHAALRADVDVIAPGKARVAAESPMPVFARGAHAAAASPVPSANANPAPRLVANGLAPAAGPADAGAMSPPVAQRPVATRTEARPLVWKLAPGRAPDHPIPVFTRAAQRKAGPSPQAARPGSTASAFLPAVQRVSHRKAEPAPAPVPVPASPQDAVPTAQAARSGSTASAFLPAVQRASHRKAEPAPVAAPESPQNAVPAARAARAGSSASSFLPAVQRASDLKAAPAPTERAAIAGLSESSFLPAVLRASQRMVAPALGAAPALPREPAPTARAAIAGLSELSFLPAVQRASHRKAEPAPGAAPVSPQVATPTVRTALAGSSAAPLLPFVGQTTAYGTPAAAGRPKDVERRLAAQSTPVQPMAVTPSGAATSPASLRTIHTHQAPPVNIAQATAPARPTAPTPAASGERAGAITPLTTAPAPRRATNSDEAAPTIRVSIGRIRIEGPPPAPAKVARFHRPAPTLTLANYAQRRNGRRP